MKSVFGHAPRHRSWSKGKKLRCSVDGCGKRAKDFNPPLCRIHSPCRKGYKK